jgi:anti-sigma B factor antagonist
MNIEKKLENGVLTLAVGGRLDTNTSPELEAEVTTEGVSEIVFDFAALEYISSAGLRVLMGAQKALAATGGKVRVVNPNAMVKGVLDITGVSVIFC